MIFQPDPLNPITLVSEYTVYNPRIPFQMNFPNDFCGDNGNILVLVGSIPAVRSFLKILLHIKSFLVEK